MLKIIESELITAQVSEMCQRVNYNLSQDVYDSIQGSLVKETSENGKEILNQIIENAHIAREDKLPLCQDTGLATFFVKIGQDVHIKGKNIDTAIQDGVKEGYSKGYLRKSICSPFSRINTKDNTPAIIHYEMVDGNELKIDFLAKGGGSENMSRVAMLAPSQGEDGIIDFVVNSVKLAGANPCPPIIVGVGIGGSFDLAPILAKKALLQELNKTNDDHTLSRLESTLLDKINGLGIGPMGLGGLTTCLAVKIKMAPCHIASLPLAVNIQCHSSRHASIIL